MIKIDEKFQRLRIYCKEDEEKQEQEENRYDMVCKKGSTRFCLCSVSFFLNLFLCLFVYCFLRWWLL